jgi:hypothetical protein
MAGTLVITTLSDGTNSTSATNPIKGSAKAWVNFNGTGTVSITQSFNVSSITDNGVGDYTVNFTTAMPNANFEVASTGEAEAANPTHMRCVSVYNGSKTTSSVRVISGGLATSTDFQDLPAVFVTIFSS